MRCIPILLNLTVLTALLLGCASSGENPVLPTEGVPGMSQSAENADAEIHDPHMLWGQWTFYFNEDHTAVDAVPLRFGQLHLNALKFLENYCQYCLLITKIKNNGDGTTDLTVQIKHPFPDNPEYTGFDAKGIIMFTGSHELRFWSMNKIFPDVNGDGPDGDAKFYVSWKELGDPEVMNPDGYSVLWSPWWISDSTMPIFNYWPGKYSHGTPTANINAFLNFYTDEPRHMFRVDGTVERTYTLYLPPGPLTAGYAVDACWEPPSVTPVTDPNNDFPVTANQPEPYYYRYVLNNDEPITFKPCCGAPQDCTDLRHEYSKWYGEMNRSAIISFPYYPGWQIKSDGPMILCSQCPPEGVVWLNPTADYHFVTNYYEEDGIYRGVAVSYHATSVVKPKDFAYSVFDFIIDLE